MLKFVIACICAGDCVFAKLTFVGVQICLYSCEWVYVCVDVCVCVFVGSGSSVILCFGCGFMFLFEFA